MILGIDPGIQGALALLSDSELFVKDLKTKTVSKNKQICEEDFSKFIDYFKHDIKAAIIEDVHAMPYQSIGRMFRFGFNTGILHGVLAAHKITTIRIRANVWKPALGLSHDKKESLKLAKKLFPKYKEFFVLAKHADRAEAALIANFAKQNLFSNKKVGIHVL